MVLMSTNLSSTGSGGKLEKYQNIKINWLTLMTHAQKFSERELTQNKFLSENFFLSFFLFLPSFLPSFFLLISFHFTPK